MRPRFYVDIMGSSDEVTGSCILCVVQLPQKSNTIKFVVDCGIYQEREYTDLNNRFDFNPKNLDFALITHTHMDHVGRLPFLRRRGFDKKIYLTTTACKLLPVALTDALRVEKNNALQTAKDTLFNEKDVNNTIKLLQPCEYEETIEVNEHIKVTFINNGHLVGAACIFVEVFDGEGSKINLLFTGDYNNRNSFFSVKEVPDWILSEPVTIIQEAIYGNINSNQIVPCFEHNLLQAIQERKTIIMPVFSLGRSQEILYLLKTLQQSKQLDVEIPIYLDGKLAVKYITLYLFGNLHINKDMLEFLPENFSIVSKDLRAQLIKESSDRKIILTTSGMGSYGPAQSYLPAYINKKNALIHFTGYCAEKTLSRKLKETENGQFVQIGGLSRIKLATVEYTSEFSSHAKADEMIAFLQKFKKINFLLVNHGEKETKQKFAAKVTLEVNTKDVGILNREYLFRIGEYGCIKTIPTKFI